MIHSGYCNEDGYSGIDSPSTCVVEIRNELSNSVMVCLIYSAS